MNAIALSDATAGIRYCILEIKEENRLVNRLSSMGLLCGSTIEVCQNHEKQPVLIFVLLATQNPKNAKIRNNTKLA